MRRLLAAIALLGLVGAPTAGARTILDAGVAALEAEMSASDSCTVGLDQELCVLAYDDAGTATVGDDEVVVTKVVREARLVLRLPVGAWGADEVVLDPADLYLPHPLFPTLNTTWLAANDTLPAALRDHLRLESREMRMMPGQWGLAVVVDHPLPMPETPLERSLDPIYQFVICWNLVCGTTTESYLVSDENGVRPARNSVVLHRENSDAVLQLLVDEDGWLGCPVWLSESTCGPLGTLRDFNSDPIGLAESVTPSVTLGFQFQRATLAIQQPPQADAGGLGTPALTDAFAQTAGERQEARPADAASFAGGSLDDLVERPSWPSFIPSLRAAEPLALATAVSGPPSSFPLLEAAFVAFALLAVAVLYHRVKERDILAHGTRARLFDAIVQAPGIRAGTLAASLALDYKTVRHHLDHLVRVGLLQPVGEGQVRYYASNAAPPPGQRDAAQALACPSRRLVFDHLKARGTQDLPSLTAELGLSKSTVSEAATALRKAGLVQRRRENRRVVLTPVARTP